MELLIKCIAFALTATLAAVVLRRYIPEISLALVLISCAVIFFLSSEVISKALQFIRSLATLAGVDEKMLAPVLKVSAVAILARMGSDVCRENGISSIATLVELCASAVAIVISIPLLESVIELICRM